MAPGAGGQYTMMVFVPVDGVSVVQWHPFSFFLFFSFFSRVTAQLRCLGVPIPEERRQGGAGPRRRARRSSWESRLSCGPHTRLSGNSLHFWFLWFSGKISLNC